VALGIDTAKPLNQSQARWKQFFDIWQESPVFAGRYFGDIQPGFPSDHAWVPGELSSLPADSPLQALRYILPLATPGPFDTTRPASKSQHNLGGQPVFFRQQGETRDGAHVANSTVRSNGQIDATATCKQIAAALSFVTTAGQPELVLPDSERVFVFLDVEPQTALHPEYWLGWAETISGFIVTKKTDIGTLALAQPFRPCLYCVVREDPINPAFGFPADHPGPWPEIATAFQETGFLSVRIRGRHACHGLASLWPVNAFASVQDSVNATEAEAQAKFPTYAPLGQSVGVDAPVVTWQYQINIGMDAAGNLFDATAAGAPVPVFEIDLSLSRSDPYENQPITDYMLRRP
jgi:hypothetical protein